MKFQALVIRARLFIYKEYPVGFSKNVWESGQFLVGQPCAP